MVSKCIDRIMKAVEMSCMLMCALAVVFITMQVFFRYFLRAPLGWTEQISRYFFIWIVMLGIPIMFHRKGEISFDYLREKLTGKKHDMVMISFEIMGIVFCSFYFVFSIQLCLRTGNRMTSGVTIPLNLLYASQPVSAFLTVLVMIDRLRELIAKMRKGGES